MNLRDTLTLIAGLLTIIGIAMLFIGSFWIGWETYNSVSILDRDDRPLGLMMMGAALMGAGCGSFNLLYDDKKPTDANEKTKGG